VYLACLIDDDADVRFVPEIERRVWRLVCKRIRPRWRKALAVRSLVRSKPVTVDYFYSRPLQRQVDEIVDSVDIDAVFCFSSPMAEYVFRSRHAEGKLRRARRVVDLIDVDSHKWRQYAEGSSAWRAWVYRYEAAHLAAYERRIALSFDRVLVVSEAERRMFPMAEPCCHIEVLSNGVDLDYFRPTKGRDDDTRRPTIVFTGVMDYWPNVEGMMWFVQSVLPRVRAAVPDVELLIVGSRPTKEIERLASYRGVVITGVVEDVRPFVARADACIAPLRIARGIQNKVLEGMAMGKAVVCTPQAHEGVRAQAGRDLVLAESEEEFASATVDLLRDSEKAEVLGGNARQFVERNYAWESNLAVLDRLLVADAARPVAHELSPDCGMGVLG
ncbi:MAG: TIGR03087 family PEP-CTERM/XrtA system glycosyltransferase, partial [bacterium]